MNWVFIAAGILLVLLLLFLGLVFVGGRLLAQRGVVTVADDDPRMQDAMERARATRTEFIQRMQNPSDGQSSAAVKVRVVEGPNIEHAWLAEPRVDGDEVLGRLDNDLVKIKRWKAGDTVRAGLADLSDWLVIDSGRLIGGFTIRVLRDQMSARDRERFDRDAKFVVDDQPRTTA